MVLLTALDKRIKRHVIGPVREFFVVTAPGLEQLCFDELMQLPLSCREASIVAGGIEFKGRLHDCYLANLHLRLANRILMRITRFKATNFHKLEQKIAQISWELYLLRGCDITINVSSRHSRLYHSDAVGEIFEKKVIEHLDASASEMPHTHEAHPNKQQIFVRIVDDQCTVSLDSSGELLHKRGIKSHRAAAPLRETIAAEILRLAEFAEKEPLIDPMCGSGTFSLEAAMIRKHIPAGWFRDFAFMGWPGFRPERWQYMRKQCQAAITASAPAQIFASDKDEKVCTELKQCVERYDLADTVQVMGKDFFQLFPAELTAQKGLVVLNPPYGLRIGTQSEVEKLFREICERLQEVYAGWKFALLVPNRELLKKIPFRNTREYLLRHGGLRVVLLVGRIPAQK